MKCWKSALAAAFVAALPLASVAAADPVPAEPVEILPIAFSEDGLSGAGGERLPHEQLSERELQVFLRLAQGETIGHAAQSLSLSIKTVSTYRTRVMEKMALQSNSDLTYYALKNGLIR
jgi:DNA-binding NarL/FixJ family response regulator